MTDNLEQQITIAEEEYHRARQSLLYIEKQYNEAVANEVIAMNRLCDLLLKKKEIMERPKGEGVRPLL